MSWFLNLFLSLSVLLDFLSLASSKKCSCRHKIFENNKRVSIYFCAASPKPVELKLVKQRLFCDAYGVTVDLGNLHQLY